MPIFSSFSQKQVCLLRHLLLDASRKLIQDMLLQVINNFEWDGPVGFSVTRNMAKRLGCESTSFATMDRELGQILSTAVESDEHPIVRRKPKTKPGRQ